MTAVLALASALIIGTSDFAGGLATRRDNSLRVTFVAQMVGLATAIVLAVAVGADEVTTRDVVGGVAAGLSGSFSFICFYRALAQGTMSVVAPTTAVVGASVPAIVSVARGERLSVAAAIGVVLAIVAIVMVTRERSDPLEGERSTPAGVLGLAVVAGLGFSIFFISLSETADEAGMWPLVVARLVSVPIVAVIALRLAGGVLPHNTDARRLAVFTGLSEMAANAILLVALRRGEVAIASVFGSLYPVSTVLLAWGLLRERLGRTQLIGVGIALAALCLVAL